MNELCVHCRILGTNRIGLENDPSQRRNFYKLGSLSNLVLRFSPALFTITLIFLIGSQYDFLSIFWQKNTGIGILAPDLPLQTEIHNKAWKHKGYLFRPLAKYKIRARVLLKSNYWLSAGAELSPIDLTLGWGPIRSKNPRSNHS